MPATLAVPFAEAYATVTVSELVLESFTVNTNGVVSVNTVRVENLTNVTDGREYSEVYHDVQNFTHRGVVVPPAGGIFELKFPDEDILGRAI